MMRWSCRFPSEPSSLQTCSPASTAIFLGQANVIPEPLRIPPLLATPVLAVLVTMFYWLWRVQIRRVLVTRS